jgi:tetratricopeptide (TPR) repeat protein
MMAASTGRFSSLLLEGLDEYRRGNMQAAVKAWEEAYTLEPTNPRAREFLHSALERIYAQMGVDRSVPGQAASRPMAPAQQPAAPLPRPSAEIRRPPSSPPPPVRSTPPAVSADGQSDASVLLGGARDLISQRDHSGALELLGKVLQLEPDNGQAQKLYQDCETVLTQQLEAKLGGLNQRPRVLLKPDEIRWLDLDPRAGFILAQIDGAVSYEDLYDICGLERLDTVRILAQLVDEKVIGAGRS